MSDFKITVEQLEFAKRFFRDSHIDTLTATSSKINREQPNFTAVALAWQKHGLNIISVEDLLETIFIVYYIQTTLNKKSIPTITFGQIVKNVNEFIQFNEYYNLERDNVAMDLSQIKFIRDELVLTFAAETLSSSFGTVGNIPREVFLGYFALLKAIERGAEKIKK